jgi:hypothetical protein
MQSVKTGQMFNCSDIINDTNGWYNCTFNTSGMPAKYYHIIMNSSRDYYNPSILNKSNAFFVETPPVLAGESVTPSGDGGWGESYTFRVNVTDEDSDTVSVYLWVNKSTGWDLAGSNTTVTGENTTVTFVKGVGTPYFSGADIGQRQFVFNATDDPNYPVLGGNTYTGETPVTNFTLDKNDIVVELIQGNGSVVNRTNPQLTFEVKFWDVDKVPNETIGNGRYGKFWWTYDNQNFLESSTKNTLQGSITLTQTDVSMDCSYRIGPQQWLAGTVGNIYYKDKNSSMFNWTIITNNLTAGISLPNGESYLSGINPITIMGNVTDDCGLVNGSTVVFKVPQIPYTCTPTNSEGSGWYNCTIPALHHTAWSNQFYNVSTEASKDYYNGTYLVKENAFYLATRPTFSGLSVLSEEGSSTGGWGEVWTFSVSVQDIDGNNVTVYLWINRTGEWELYNSTTLTATNPTPVVFGGITFNCSDLSEQTSRVLPFKFNVTDTWNYTNNVSSTFTVERDDVSIDHKKGTGTSVDREGSDFETLVLRISDLDRELVPVGSGIKSIFYVTTDGSNYDWGNTTTTDSESNITYHFNPNCSYNVGVQKWRGGTYNDTCYQDSAPESGYTITIKGQLKNYLEQPYNGSVVPVGNNMTVRANVTSECSDL